MTEKQGVTLLRLQYELKKIALPVGSMHSYWDVIFDIQGLLDKYKLIEEKAAAEMIEYAEGLLKGPGKSKKEGQVNG